jgi:Tfp pilus assembly protein PilO
MKIEKRQQFLIVLTIVALALLVGDRLVYEPLARLWSARSAQIKQLQTKVRDGKVLVRRAASLRSEWSSMRTNALPVSTAQAEQQLLAALDNWSHGSGAEINNIMPQWKNDSTNYMTLNCRVEAKGAIGAVSQLIYDIEKGPMALKLDSVELTASDGTGQQLSFAAQISGLVLVQPIK